MQFTRIRLERDNTRKCSKHMHPHFELYILLEGEVEFIVEEDRRHLYGGDIVLTRGGEYHNTAVVEPKPYDHCFFYFSENTFPKFSDKIHSPLTCFTDREQGHNNYLHPDPIAWNRITTLIERLTELLSESEKHTSDSHVFAKYAASIELFEIINNCYESSYFGERRTVSREPADNSITHPVVNRAIRYIDLNFRTIGDIGEVAAACSVSHPYLSRLFKENLGVSPGAYLRQKRLSYAKLMLLNGYDVTSTCYYCGFHDYSYFIQVFRSEEGMTPFAYRRVHSGNSDENNKPD